MKIYINTAILSAALAALLACQPKEQIDFALDKDSVEIGSEGGTFSVDVSSSESWIATANKPWITVSPANGTGSQECRVIVDSALVLSADEPVREGIVTIQTKDWESRDITVRQRNFDYTIAIDENEIKVPDYEALSDRVFNVTVKSNVKFSIRFEDEDGQQIADPWIAETDDNPALSLTKGARPRNVTLGFSWDINQYPDDRVAHVVFVPVDEAGDPITVSPENVARMDKIKVTQTSAAPKPEKPRAADSTALVSISRALNVWSGGWDTSTRMERWENVILWEEGDKTSDGTPIPDEWAGRVRYARFFMFNTDDGLPYQVGWLDAAEELVFYSNENFNFRKDIKLGEDITKLSNLKRLTISAYGLDNDSFPESFWSAFANLEYLDLSSNNFTSIDDRFNETNFPKLRAFMMRNNQKTVVYDLSNAATSNVEQFTEKYAGLFLENQKNENKQMGTGFPVRLLLWDNLDTLQLTLNYLEGSIPTDSQIMEYFSSHGVTDNKWTGSERIDYIEDGDEKVLVVADSLAANSTFFQNNTVPKVLPRIRNFAINLNRFSGQLSPDTHKWLFYHPNMDWWDPSTFVFTQEGTDSKGNAARFTGIPVNMDYYYNVYTRKKFAD